MKLTGLGKLALFLVALGLAAGAFRLATQSRSKTSISGGSGGTPTPAPHGSATQGSTDGGNGTGAPAPVAANEIMLLTNPGKRGWLDEQIEKFNATSEVKIKARFLPTREAMHSILDQNVHPALWSPSSIIWADRVAQVKGNDLLDTGDAASYRAVLRTPLVFLTTKAKAATLRPLLSSQSCWQNIEAISSGKKPYPGGNFKWAHADPLQSNTGMLTLALIVADYAARNNRAASVEKLANDPAFLAYFKRVESRAAYNSAVQKGSTALLKSFVEDPSRYDFITAYEAQAIGAALQNPDLAVIYPNPTANAENAVAFLNWPELSSEQKTAGQAFLKFIAQPEAAQDGLKEHYRPLRAATLNAELERLRGNGFQTNYSAIELPPYTALNGVAFKWKTDIARK